MVKIWRFLTACSGGVLGCLMLAIVLSTSLINEAQAGNCTGGHRYCANYNNKWQVTSTNGYAPANINVKQFQYPDKKYPLRSNTVPGKTPDILVDVDDNRGITKNSNWVIEPLNGFTPAGGGFRHKDIPGATLYVTVKGGDESQKNVATNPMNYPITLPKNSMGVITGSRSYALEFTVRIIWDKQPNNKITLKQDPMPFLKISVGGQQIAQVNLTNKEIAIPPSKTCVAQGRLADRTINIGTHDISAFNHNAEVGDGSDTITLKECPSGSKVKLRFNEAPTSLGGTNNVYLINRQEAATAAKGVGVKLYYNGTTDAFTIGKDKPITTAACAGSATNCNSSVNIHARLYKTGTTAVTPGYVKSQAILTITYE